MLQCVAVCLHDSLSGVPCIFNFICVRLAGELLSVAVYCSVVAVHCSMCCSMCCSVLQFVFTIHSAAYLAFEIWFMCALQCCSAVAVQLQCVAECLDESPGSVPWMFDLIFLCRSTFSFIAPYLCKRAQFSRKIALYLRRKAIHLRKRALYFHKRALYLCEMANYLLEWSLYFCKRALNFQKRALYVHKRALYLCKRRFICSNDPWTELLRLVGSCKS